MMGVAAGVVLDREFVSLGVSRLRDHKFRSDYDAGMMRIIIRQLEALHLEIQLITWPDLMKMGPDSLNLVVIPQWFLNGERNVSNNVPDNRKLKKIKELLENGVSFVLMHHFYPEIVFQNLLDIDFYEEGDKLYIKGKSSIELLNNKHELVKNVESIIQRLPKYSEDEEFTYLSGQKGKFQVLISKNRKKKYERDFILFGYQKMNTNSSVYIIDLHNTGESKTQSLLFELLFRNTLQYISGSGDLEETVNTDINSQEIENYSYIGKEGASKQVLVNKYERDPKLRREAIKVHKVTCKACNFNFYDFYGEHGKDFIEVHHVKPLSKVKGETDIDPKTDMIVLCSNCHRMIHRNPESPLSLEELKEMISEKYVP